MSILTAVLYARVSSREQQQEGYSIDAQVKLLRSVAAEKSYRIVREFVEVESAKASGRKQFAEMVAFFKRNRSCRMLLVEKVDRLYRNQHDAITLEDLDIEIFFVKEGEILSKNSKSHVKFMHDIRLAIARNYSENLREEVKKGMREKAEQGAYPGPRTLRVPQQLHHAQHRTAPRKRRYSALHFRAVCAGDALAHFTA